MFQIGDFVVVLDEDVEGVVHKIGNQSVQIKTKDEFVLNYHPSELIKTGEGIQVSNHQAAIAKQEKEVARPKKSPFEKNKNKTVLEVDLHIEKLTKSWKSLDSYDILELQMQTAKRQIDFALSKQISTLIFIHGHGEGVLKKELEYLLNKYKNASYSEASFRKYGMGGATQVVFS
jgi:dsDNA-specific endonuclease/ATPase MutS2